MNKTQLGIVEVHFYHAEFGEGMIEFGGLSLDFSGNSVIEAEADVIGWADLWEPYMKDLRRWVAQAQAAGNEKLMTLWQHVVVHEMTTDGPYVESYAECLGLIDCTRWTPEGLMLVEAVQP